MIYLILILTNKIIKQNAYVGGIYEIEIDGIEPGCYKYLGTQDVCKNHRYVIQGDFENYINIDDTNNKLVLKEIIFKDTPVDIYFNGDIDGLYKNNDIIKIDGLEIEVDHIDFIKIKEVDYLNNKITVENAIVVVNIILDVKNLKINIR